MQNQSNNTNDDVIEIDLQALFGLLLHWAWLIIACGIGLGIAGFLVSKLFITPLYESSTKIYILNRQSESTITYSDVQLGTVLTKDYAQLIQGRDVLERVIENCALDTSYASLVDRVAVEALSDTRIIKITVTDPDPVLAQLIANEVREVSSECIQKVMDVDAVNVAEQAYLPETPSSPNVRNWTLIAFLVGIFLCSAILVIRYLLDDTIKTADDVERYLGLSTLANIPIREDETKKKKKKKNTASRESGSASSEHRHYHNHSASEDAEIEVEELDTVPDKAVNKLQAGENAVGGSADNKTTGRVEAQASAAYRQRDTRQNGQTRQERDARERR